MHFSKRSCQPGSVFQSFPIVSNRCEMFRDRKRDPCLPACVWPCHDCSWNRNRFFCLKDAANNVTGSSLLSAHWCAARSGGIISLRSCCKMPLVGVRRPWAESELKGHLDHLLDLQMAQMDRLWQVQIRYSALGMVCFYRRPVGFPNQDSLSLIDSCQSAQLGFRCFSGFSCRHWCTWIALQLIRPSERPPFRHARLVHVTANINQYRPTILIYTN